MATTQEKQERIEVFARKLAEEFGEVDDSNALSWLDAVALQDGAHVPEPSCLLLIGYAILVQATGGRTVRQPSAVSGNGNSTGSGTNFFEGDLTPGSSPGTMSFGGDVVLGTSSTTEIELGGTVRGDEYDAIIVDGDFTLDGSLNVLKIGGYAPQAGDLFDILDFEPAKLSGLFSTVSLPALASGLDWDQTNLYTTGELLVSLATSQISGDFDGDGDVDAADYTVWQDNLGLDAAALGGNGSGAAIVVQADYQLWKTHFGESIASGSTADPVPEPATLLLALAAVPLCMRHR